MLLQNSEAMVAIDMPAGPSEVLVIADAAANPTHIAIDLLSQVGGLHGGRGAASEWPDAVLCPAWVGYGRQHQAAFRGRGCQGVNSAGFA